MLQINNLKLTHAKDYRVLIDGLTFALNKGDKMVVIGEEGEGKSSLLKWIYDPLLIRDYAEVEGSKSAPGEKIAYLPQELPAKDRSKSVYEFMSEEAFFVELNPAELSFISKDVGLSSDLFYSDQTMESLSGGEKVKVQIARMLASRPTILLLDEPSNDIDIETLEWLERLINGSAMGILFISHDEILIEKTANKVLHIEQLYHKTQPRHTVANLPYRQYAQERLHGFELQESQAKMERKRQQIAEEKWRKIYQRVEHEQNVISRGDPSGGRLLKKKMHSVKSQGRRLEKQRESITEMPHFEREINLAFDYDVEIPRTRTILRLEIPRLCVPQDGGEKLLSRDIVLEMRGSEKICITGKNGAGKTTLMRLIVEELEKNKNTRIAYMPQNYDDLLDPDATPEMFLAKSCNREERVMIHNRLASLRFTPDDMKRRIQELSGGQKAKLILLSMTLSGADVLLLDEPTRNFSPLSGPVIRGMLSGFSGAIISVSHDRKFIDEVPDKVYELTDGGLKLLT